MTNEVFGGGEYHRRRPHCSKEEDLYSFISDPNWEIKLVHKLNSQSVACYRSAFLSLWKSEGDVACVCVCVCLIWSRPPEAEGIWSAMRTPTSGRPSDSWLPQMMHWPWHPNWPQYLSWVGWGWWFRLCPPYVCFCTCPPLSLAGVAYKALILFSVPLLLSPHRYSAAYLCKWRCLCMCVCVCVRAIFFLNVPHTQSFGQGCTSTDLYHPHLH